MKIALLIFWSVAALGSSTNVEQQKFPKDFIFGTGTSAYQIEGGWNADDKRESIWDYMTHNTPDAIEDNSNGDIAADSYHNYKRDVEMMRELGINMYRFSLSWPRILPTGFSNFVSKAGVAYYNNLIDEMLKYNIQPMVTIYHWDLPQNLQEMGGFMNPLVVDWFEDFARVVYKAFGDRVKHWVTFNEAYQICYQGYGSDVAAPRLNATGMGEYVCARNLLLSHARAYHIYNEEFKPSQGGQCGFTIAITAALPLNNTAEDQRAVEIAMQSEWAIYTDPIYTEKGGFPKELLDVVAKKSKAQGYSRSRLVDFNDEEKKYIAGTSDFFGLNHYTGLYYSYSLYKPGMYPIPSMKDDIEIASYAPKEWRQASSPWLKLCPDSLYIVLKKLQKRYSDKYPIYVTENGWSTQPGIKDDDRIFYYREALQDVLRALAEGINLKGYFAWSHMDNFEWSWGYTARFGLYEVDFTDPARKRTPRKSAFVYKQIIKSRVVDPNYEPENYVMTIDSTHN